MKISNSLQLNIDFNIVLSTIWYINWKFYKYSLTYLSLLDGIAVKHKATFIHAMGSVSNGIHSLFFRFKI